MKRAAFFIPTIQSFIRQRVEWKIRSTCLLLLLFVASDSRSQGNPVAIHSIVDFFKALEDPSISPQSQAIADNHVRSCVISKWEHTPNNDSLELQSDSTLIYYNDQGQIDSLINYGYNGIKEYYLYDSNHYLIEQHVVETEMHYLSNRKRALTDTAYHYFEYKDNLLSQEIIKSMAYGDLDINYNWSDGYINEISIHKGSDLIKTYTFGFKNNKFDWRKSSSIENNKLTTNTNKFIYEGDQLVELTNTWMLANDSLRLKMAFDKTDEEEMAKMLNTKYAYNTSGTIKSLQKVIGFWPGESFWVTEFSYENTGLLKTKKETNNGEFGLTEIIYTYEYRQ